LSALWGRNDKQSRFDSNLCEQYGLIWDVLSDGTMGQEGTGSREDSIILIRLFIMRSSGGECLIVGRDCNDCVNNCRAEWEKSLTIHGEWDQYSTRQMKEYQKKYFTNVLWAVCKLEHNWCNRFTAVSSQHNCAAQVHTFSVTTCH